MLKERYPNHLIWQMSVLLILTLACPCVALNAIRETSLGGWVLTQLSLIYPLKYLGTLLPRYCLSFGTHVQKPSVVSWGVMS